MHNINDRQRGTLIGLAVGDSLERRSSSPVPAVLSPLKLIEREDLSV